MADEEEVSLFLVATLATGPYIAGIYEIKFRVGGVGGGSEVAVVSPLEKAFKHDPHKFRTYVPVGCDISGSQLFLMASYLDVGYRYVQLEPFGLDTNTKKCVKFPFPEATKPHPIVMAVREKGFYVLAGGTRVSGVAADSPCFERLDPHKGWDDDYASLPEYRLDRKLPRAVSGYAVIKDCILISVFDFISRDHKTEFYYYRVGSEMNKWQVVKKEKENGLYYPPLGGKAECVDDYVYTFGRNYNLIAYQVVEKDGIIQSIGVPLYFRRLDFKDLPVDYKPVFSPGCLVHLGNKIFCLMKTGSNLDPFDDQYVSSNFQYVSILIVQLSDDMEELSTLWSGLCALNIENLGPASLTSLCFDSQRSKYAHMSEFWKRCPKVQSKQYEEVNVDTHLQPVNTDPPKLEPVHEGSQAAGKRVGSALSVLLKRIKENIESVDDLLLLLGLENNTTTFEYEDIDMATLVHLADDDLKALGLPEGPRKKILSALETEV